MKPKTYTFIMQINNFAKNLVNKPVVLTLIILMSMIFCFSLAENSGTFGQWFLLVLGAPILLLSTSGVPESWKIQLLISFILAIPIEYILSVYLGWYSYSYATVPPWVFIGHSIVHFGALVLGLYLLENQKYKNLFIKFALLTAVLYGIGNLIFLDDQIGFICTIIMTFLIGYKTKYQLFYASFWMFVVWLEWWGVFFNQCIGLQVSSDFPRPTLLQILSLVIAPWLGLQFIYPT